MRRTLASIILCAPLAGAASKPAMAQESCAAWSAGEFPLAGANGSVWAMAKADLGDGPALYLAGNFDMVGATFAKSVARFDGRTAQPLGEGVSGGYATVAGLVAFDAGTGPVLVAAGEFSRAGVEPARNVASWDGRAWRAVGQGIEGFVTDLAVFDDGSGRGAELYASGSLRSSEARQLRGVARWNGSAWIEVGSGLDGTVNAIEVFDDGTGPALYAVGWFRRFESTATEYIARYDGLEWRSLGTGLDRSGKGLAVYDDGSGPALIVSGEFTRAGGVAASHIARWDGTRWSALGAGTGFMPNALAVVSEADRSTLFVGGSFSTAGGREARSIASWNGSSWASVGLGFVGSIYCLETFDDSGGPAVYAGGGMTTNGPESIVNVARFDGIRWTPLFSGIDASVRDLIAFDDGSGPALFAARALVRPPFDGSRGLAKWDGRTWSGVDGGLDRMALALETHDDGRGLALYVGGTFARAGGQAASRIARWDGVAFETLANGFTEPSAAVVDLASFDDGSGPSLFVAGSFGTASGVPAANVARWDGERFWPVGSGLPGSVWCLAIHDDGSGPALHAGGAFRFPDSRGGTTAVARWDGTTWSPVGTRLEGEVRSLLSHDFGDGGANLIAAGDLGTGDASSIPFARLVGSAWVAFDAGLSRLNTQISTSLATLGEGPMRQLLAGGCFAGASPGQWLVARWRNGQWRLVDGDQHPSQSTPVQAKCLTVARFGAYPSLFVGGYFTAIGSTVSGNVGRFDDPCAYCAGGTVNAGIGAVQDVLFVNDSAGGPARRIELLTYEPIEAFVQGPPSATAPTPFALYLWDRPPVSGAGFLLPGRIGATCLPTPLSLGGDPAPTLVWNNTGRARLGSPNRNSTPAPSRVFRLQRGTERPVTFFLQGLIADPGSAAPHPVSVTNGITVVVR